MIYKDIREELDALHKQVKAQSRFNDWVTIYVIVTVIIYAVHVLNQVL